MKFKAMLYQNPVGIMSAFAFLVFSAISFFFDKKIFLLLLLAFLLMAAACAVYSAYSITATRRYVAEINKSLSLEETENVDSFPLPGAICDPYGNLVWYNKLFGDDILVGRDSKAFSFLNFFETFSFDTLSEETSVQAKYRGRYYTVFITKIHSDTVPLLSMYFLDDTYFKTTEHEYAVSRPFVMLLIIDNIEMMYRQLSDSKFALISSGIESLIENWIKDENLIFKKTANGRFLLIGEKRNLDNLSAGKFSVLSAVREYKYNNTPVDATLSIGVGTGSHFTECEERAKKAIDMALGRGGDQAAVYTDNGYVYFGGMSNKMNDNSRVSPRQTAANISNLIKKHDKVLIMGHKFSDYDSIGAAMGMLFFSHSVGAEARVVVDRKKSLSMPLVSMVEKEDYNIFLEPEDALKLCDAKTLLIVVDTHRPTLVECPELYEKASSKVVIDHHRRMEDFISDAEIFYHLPSPSSTCEMVAELIEYSSIQEKLPPIIATGLLSGIVLDTKDYVLRTSQRTFEAAAFLKQSGANTVSVRKLFSIDGEQIELKNSIINSGTNYHGCMIAVTDSTDKNLRVVSSKAADEMLNIDGVKASFVIAKLGDSVNISARSLGEENVQLIMENLGGGGHSTMAAAQLNEVSLPEAAESLKKAIDEYYLNK